MEIRIILRGVLSGFVAGVLGFAFARIFAEPYIQQAINYESGRDDAITATQSNASIRKNAREKSPSTCVSAT